MKHKLVFMTGAGISKESGIATFRDSADGLWHNYNIEDVSSIEGWKKDPSVVLSFFNDRRREVQAAQPNDAHKIIAELEEHYDVTIITQNVDDLHERGGSSRVIHLHGSILRACEDPLVVPLMETYFWDKDINMGDNGPHGVQLRPDIVMFGENVKSLNKAVAAVREADVYIIVGTSLQVFPASNLHLEMKPTAAGCIIDPVMDSTIQGFVHIEYPATVGMQHLKDMLLSPGFIG